MDKINFMLMVTLFCLSMIYNFTYYKKIEKMERELKKLRKEVEDNEIIVPFQI